MEKFFEHFGVEKTAAAVNAGALSPKEVVDGYCKLLEDKGRRLNAVISLDQADAAKQAERLTKRLAAGEQPPLAGVPITIKDNICTKDVLTTCASKMLKDFRPIYDATVIEKLKSDGALLIGKANLDEFAMGSSNEHSFFGPVKNPYNESYVSGGSSGGSAALVGGRVIPASLGSDTGGSIRLPASFCGAVGLKPTYGAVSRFGLVAFGSSLDQIGPFAESVMDAALVFRSLCGKDPKDSTTIDFDRSSLDRAISMIKNSSPTLKGKKIGLPRQFAAASLHPDVSRTFESTKEHLVNLGAQMVEVDIPQLERSVAAYYIVAPAEVSSNLARFDGIRFGYSTSGNVDDLEALYLKNRSEGFGVEVKRRIMLGTYTLAAGHYHSFYGKANLLRKALRLEFRAAFEHVDAILSPVAPEPAFKIGQKVADPIAMYQTDFYTIAANLTGVPAISLPAGYSEEGLPIGVQLMGNWEEDGELLQLASSLEGSLALRQGGPDE